MQDIYQAASVFQSGVVGPETDEPETGEQLASLIVPDEILNSAGLSSGTFGKLQVQSYVEEHSEKYVIHNSLSESAAVFCSGANAVSVNITGRLLLSQSDDHFAEFIDFYARKLRARELQDSGLVCTFLMGGMSMNLYIEMIGLRANVQTPDAVDISIQAVAGAFSPVDDPVSLEHTYVSSLGGIASRPPETSRVEEGGLREEDVRLVKKGESNG